MSIERDVATLMAKVDNIRDNHFPSIYSRLGKVEGGIAVLLLLGIAAFARSFF